MYRVEFIGPPGAGKSTIYKKIVQHLQTVGRDNYLTMEEAVMRVSRSKMDNIYRYIMKCLPYDFAVKFSNKLANRSLMQFDAQNRFIARWGRALDVFITSEEFDKMSLHERTLVLSAFIETGSNYECINGELPGDTVVFFEEGFIQKSFMFISPLDNGNGNKHNLSGYLDNIPLPDLAIYVNAAPASCYERMVARPAGLTKRLNEIDKDGIMNFLKTSDTHLQYVVSWLKENKTIKVFEVDNNNDTDSVVHTLLQKKDELFR